MTDCAYAGKNIEPIKSSNPPIATAAILSGKLTVIIFLERKSNY